MALAARRLDLDPLDLARTNLVSEFPYRTPSGGLYSRATSSAAWIRRGELVDYPARREEQTRARRSGRLYGIGVACVVEPSISNMGYVTLVEDEDSRSRSLPKSGNAEGATVTINPQGGISVQLSTTPQGQGHATVIAQVVADALGVSPRPGTRGRRDRHRRERLDDRLGQLFLAVLGRRRRRSAARRRAGGRQAARRSPRHVLDAVRRRHRVCARARPGYDGDRRRERLAASPGRHGALESGGPSGGTRARSGGTAYYAAPELGPAQRRPDLGLGRERVRGRHRRRRGRPLDRPRDACSITSRCTTPAGCSTRCSPRARSSAASPTGSARRCRRRWPTDPGGELLTGDASRTTSAPRRATSPRCAREHRETPSPLTPLGAKGLGEGTTMSVPSAIHNAVLDALDRDAPLPLPLTPGATSGSCCR